MFRLVHVVGNFGTGELTVGLRAVQRLLYVEELGFPNPPLLVRL